MTDNEIIKALECCINHEDCAGCPSFIDEKEDCRGIAWNEVLDLINRQQAEIENLKDILYDAEGVNLVNYWHQQYAIAENGCKNFNEENKNLKAEIERLQKENDELGKAIAGAYELNCFLEATRKIVRAEAIKEFAERLKEKQQTFTGDEYIYKFIYLIEIDNLVKEMVGENE